MLRLRHLFAICLSIAVSAAAGLAHAADEAAAPGQALYLKNCAQCHGDKGDGVGPATPYVLPKPRDFTKGKFKIRSTPSGALPTDDDLRTIIRVGMPYTAMPGWPQFSDAEVEGLVQYVKSFSPDFANPERKPKPIELPGAPSSSAEAVERGKKLYIDNGCAGCHGDLGRGNGSSAPTLKDDWGNSIRPADLTQRWTFRGGASREAIFRAFSTGLNGTPMPSYADSLSVEQRWDLVDYIASLGAGEDPDYANLVIAKKVEKPIELSDETLFEGAAPANFPVFGQVIQPGRSFHPGVTGISTRAVYNEVAFAIELRWNDLRADQTGKNAPDLPVPPEEDHAAAAAAATTADASADDPWGGAATEDAPAAAADPWGDAAAPEAAPAGAADPWAEEGAAAAPAADAGFSDAVAVQIPVEAQQSIRKPYVVFGDKDHPVHLWFTDLAKKKPELWLARGSETFERLGPRDLQTTSRYDRGEWIVTFRRLLRSPGEITLEDGSFQPIAFSVWNGLDRERGNKRALTSWWTLYLEPGAAASPVGTMAQWVFGVVVLEAAFIGWARRRSGRRASSPASPEGKSAHV